MNLAQIVRSKMTILAFFVGLMVFSSCQKEGDGDVKLSPMHQKTLIENAFCQHSASPCGDVEIVGDNIIYESDMVFDKDEFLDLLLHPPMLEPKMTVPHPENPGETMDVEMTYPEDQQPGFRQRVGVDGAWGFVPNSQVTNIPYFIWPNTDADCGAAWSAEIRKAANAYNNLYNCRINFVEKSYPSTNGIVIACDNSAYAGSLNVNPGSTATAVVGGRAHDNRKVGRYILINDAKPRSSNKTGAIIHELGHNLGLRHTNSSDGWHVIGTGGTNTSSIYKSNITTNSFSASDIKTLRMIWPESLWQPQKIYVGGSLVTSGTCYINMKFKNPSNTYRPYARVVAAHRVNGKWDFRTWTDQPNSRAEYQIYWFKGYQPGNHQVWVAGASHYNEVYSPWRYMGQFAM